MISDIIKNMDTYQITTTMKNFDFQIKTADCVFQVASLYASTKTYCSDYLSAEKPDIWVEITPEDIVFEREKSIREDKVEGIPPRSFSDAYLEFIALQRKIAEHLFDWDTLLFHGSVIAVDGVGYLFTAKSGTGKSTHTQLWRQQFGDRAVVVNDDKPFLQITENGVWAYGSPWNGKHRRGTNTRVPLKAICILERGDENQIQRIETKDALKMLVQQSNRPQNSRTLPKYLELLDRMVGKVTLYRLRCNMEQKAAVVAYEAMSQSNHEGHQM